MDELDYPRIRLEGAEIGCRHETEYQAVVGPSVVGRSCRSFFVISGSPGAVDGRGFYILHEESDDQETTELIEGSGTVSE